MTRDGKPVRRLMMALILGVALLCLAPLSSVSAQDAAAANGIAIKVNGTTAKKIGLLFVSEGRLYAPVARIAELLGAASKWDNVNEELTIHTAVNDTIVLGNGVPVVYFNEGRYRMDAYPFLKSGRLYMPLRQLAELLHADMKANAGQDAIELTTVKPAVVTEDAGLDEISKTAGGSKTALLKRNDLDAKSQVKPGTKLKVIMPSFLEKPAKPFTESDLMLLAKITMVEAGYEPFEGQLALANVILNRVKDPKFPDTIHDVIYSGRQFPPAHNGLLDKSKPNASSLRAAKDALNGRNNIKDAVYFFNPEVSRGPYWSSLDEIATIGHHRFAR
ncbi:cell wall hydrolase [Paenibacillus glycinis]|uniref:Cell wall hydrolase n=1 Tax=Paenibacillus glycinis TaxID=2697035 RepID=A0ABW9XXV6_9BACL|nr:cell wall hydrolase [Paenibacillus glycinis]NBD27445.1 cell wall hydrolase [Paenibacillus glycinis]